MPPATPAVIDLAIAVLTEAQRGGRASSLLGEAISAWMVICGLVIVAGTALSTGLVRVKLLERAA